MCDRYYGDRDFSEPLLIPFTPVDFKNLIAFHNSIVDISLRPLTERWINFLAPFLTDAVIRSVPHPCNPNTSGFFPAPIPRRACH